MKFHNLRDLYVHELRDLFSSANQIVDAITRMNEATSSEELRTAFTDHLDQAQAEISTVQTVLQMLGEAPEGGFSAGTQGAIQEAMEWAEENADSAVLDAGLVASLQRLIHYEIAAFGCTRTHAKVLGETAAQHLLQNCLDDLEAADKELTVLAETLNQEAKEAA